MHCVPVEVGEMETYECSILNLISEPEFNYLLP